MTRRDIQHPARLQAMKRDSRALISAAGGVREAAEYTRVNATALSDYQSPNTDAFMPIDVAADLEAVTRGAPGFPILTRRLAAEAGCTLVKLPDPFSMKRDWLREIGQLAKDHAVIAGRLCEAAEDDDVSSSDVRSLSLIQSCDEAILHLVNLRARFERIVEEEA